MPVHRLEDSPKARVFAYRNEIDRWLEKNLNTDEGKHSLSGLALPGIALILLFALGWSFWHSLFRKKPSSIKANLYSIAVLPLENLSRDPEQEYFVEGMHEALISELSKIKSLRIISRTSVLRYRQAKKTPQEIAKELDIDAIVEGSAIHEGGQVRIMTRLIDAKTDRQIWTGKYDQDYRDVLSLWSKVAQEIAEEIKVTLTGEEKSRLGIPAEVDRDAYEAYLHGIYLLNKFDAGSLEKSIAHFQKAIELDQGFAPAYAGLADAYVTSAMSHGTELPEIAFPKAREVAIKALVRDPYCSQAYLSLALTDIYHYWDWSGAEKNCERALALSPSGSRAHQVKYSYLAMMAHHDEALDEMIKAQKMDPLSPIVNADLGVALISARRYEEAVKQLKKTIELEARFTPAIWALGEAYRRQGRYDEAIAHFQKALTASGEHPNWLGPLGLAYAEAGRKDEARKTLSKLETAFQDHQNVSLIDIAAIHTVLGETTQGLYYLELAVDKHDPQAPWYRSDRAFKNLHKDPRFKELLKKMGFTE
jgi:TolB-like protein/Tfp pilus assembly protein PilF